MNDERIEMIHRMQKCLAQSQHLFGDSSMPLEKIEMMKDAVAIRDYELKSIGSSLGDMIAKIFKSHVERDWVEKVQSGPETRLRAEVVVMSKAQYTFLNSCIVGLLARETGERIH